MATNREMLKEAIAEAKAVKEMAIANAKAALEETFTPQLKSMLSLKLQEMEEEELEEDGFGKMNAEPETGFSSMGEKALDEEEMEEGEGENMYEVDLEELLAELENEKMDESLNEAEEEEGEEEGEEESEEDEPLDLEDMTDKDLKKMIEDVIADMINSGELEAGHEGGEENEENEEGEEMEMSDEEEVNLDELLKEIEDMDETMDEEMKDESMNEGEEIEEGLGDFFKNLLKGAEEKWLDQTYPDWKNVTDDAKKNELIQKFNAEMKAAGVQPEYLRSMNTEILRLLGRGGGSRAASAISIAREGVEKDELKEAYNTIETLKAELNEINLLNAKLLYSNKIFKAKNLNENQKVKVLSSFDKAKNVGEVKMVYETLNEGIKVKKETIKENLGRASKGTTTPTTKQPIVESNDVFARMQKLAGLI